MMREVRILRGDNWQDRHWKTITSLFNKSPWFEHYRHDLEELYLRRFEFLIDWNLACFEWAADKMAIKTNVSLSRKPIDLSEPRVYLRDLGEEELREPEIDDWRGRLMPATINKVYPEVKRYPQVFEDRLGFVPNLSILDYLFCTGNRLL
jgi:hypothetical protein